MRAPVRAAAARAASSAGGPAARKANHVARQRRRGGREIDDGVAVGDAEAGGALMGERREAHACLIVYRLLPTQARSGTVRAGMTERAPGTRADWAHQRLRAAILTGELPPGTKLVVDDLAQRWSVSPTPLREAFQRLGGNGLVELTSQRGARVAPFSLDDAADLYELRLLLEPRALRGSLDHSDDAHRSEILAAHARLEASMAAADPVEASDAHLGFHTTLLARCPSAWMRRLVGLLAEHAQRYQLLGAQAYRRGSNPVQEHTALRDAAVRGQTDRAVDLLTRHLEGTLRAVRATIDANGDSPRPRARRRKA